MIIKGGPISGYRRHGTHLLKVKRPRDAATEGWNDAASLICVHNLGSGDNLPACLAEMAAVATGSRCLRFLYTASLNPAAAGGRDLTLAEAETSAQMLLDALGFSPDHQWLLVRHEKNGRAHYHIAANRVDPVLLKAVELSWSYPKQELVARDLERRFGLPPTRGAFTGRKKGQGAHFKDSRPICLTTTAESQQAERLGISMKQSIFDICQAWEAATNQVVDPLVRGVGIHFAVQLRHAGYTVARGDRRDLVVIDYMGGVHNPARRLGLKAGVFREQTRDLDIAGLPTVADVRARLKFADTVDDDHGEARRPGSTPTENIVPTPERIGKHPAGGRP